MPAFPGGDSTPSNGGSYSLRIPTGQTAPIILTQIGRVCKVLNGSVGQTNSIAFIETDLNWTFWNAQATAQDQVVDLNYAPHGGNLTITFSAATSGPITVTLV